MLGSTLPTSWTGEFDVAVRFDEDSAKCLLTATGSTDWPGTEIYGLKLENVVTAKALPPTPSGPGRPPTPWVRGGV